MFVYASTLALYVYDTTDFSLRSVIAAHERTITGLAWSPHNTSLVATTSADGRACVWNVHTEERVSSGTLPSAALAIDWDPHHAMQLVVVLERGVRILDVSAAVCTTKELFRDSSRVNMVRWNPRDVGVLATGNR
jgi:WD40 repeat protein